jgi:phospholipid/cholesterol/gamma-HCH transport system substrate-binding protein
MPANRSLDLGTGLFVVLGFAALAFLTTQLPGGRLGVVTSSEGLNITAKFDNVGDLKPGAPVAMAGVTIGRVTAVGVDTSDYRAVVSLSIDKAYGKLPDDSWANIETSGLLGAKYVGIEAGGSETFLANKGQIENTQSAMVLEKLVNRLFAAFASRGSDDKATGAKEEMQ